MPETQKAPNTVQVKRDRFGNYVKGTLLINVNAYLSDDDKREAIPWTEARQLLDNVVENLAESNDGSEIIANAPLTVVQ